jgi:hypothetical protein
LATAAALALSAAAPVMIVPAPERQPFGTWPVGVVWADRVAAAAVGVPDVAPVELVELPIA